MSRYAAVFLVLASARATGPRSNDCLRRFQLRRRIKLAGQNDGQGFRRLVQGGYNVSVGERLTVRWCTRR